MSESIQLREPNAADQPFLLRHFAAIRMPELAQSGLPEAQLLPLVEMQYRGQQQSYAQQWPAAEHRMVEVAGNVAGQLLVDRSKDEIRIIDISIQPEYRRQGIATRLIQLLIQEATESDRSVALSVAKQNRPAYALYEKLGFHVDDEDEIYARMRI